MSSPPPSASCQTKGFVLVAVLGGLLLVGSVAFAMVFTASLDSLAVRARQAAVIARAELEGALSLAAASAWSAYLAEDGAPGWLTPHYGPWPGLSFGVTVLAEELGAEEGAVVIRLIASSVADSSRRPEAMIMQVHPELMLLRRW